MIDDISIICSFINYIGVRMTKANAHNKHMGVKTFVANVNTVDGLEASFKKLDKMVEEGLPKTVTVGGNPNQEMKILDVNDTLYQFDVLKEDQINIHKIAIARRVIYYTRLID